MGFDLTTKMGYDGRGFSAGINQNLGEAKQAAQKMSDIFAGAFSGGGGLGILGGLGGSLGVTKIFEALSDAAEKVTERFTEAKTAARQMGIEIELADRIANVTHATGSSPETA